MDKKVILRAASCILGCWIIYLLFSFSSWREPVMGDEVTVVMWIKALRDGSVMDYLIRNVDPLFGTWHPPLYPHLAAFLGNFRAIDELTIRGIGIGSFLISIMLVYTIAFGLFRKDKEKERIAFLASIIYTLNPLAVKGSLLIDMDGTILNVAVLAFISALVWRRYDEKSLKTFLIYTGLFTAALCVKVATPLILIASMLIYQFLRRQKRELSYTLSIAASGVFLFLIFWSIYCGIQGRSAFNIFQTPLSVARSLFVRTGSGENIFLVARNIWAPIVWASPSFIMLGIAGFWAIFRESDDAGSLMGPLQFAFYGMAALVVYFFIGGVTHSFPKYHYAIIPVFAVLASNVIIKNIRIDRRLFINMFALLSGLILYYACLVKDPLYAVNYALKEAVINGSAYAISVIAREGIARTIFVFLAIPAAFLSIFLFHIKRNAKEAFVTALFITMLSFNIFLLSIQSGARYNTVYCYGAEGVRQAAELVLSSAASSDTVWAPPEILLLSGREFTSAMIAKSLQNRAIFLDRLRVGDVKCVVYGITGNTASQYKNIFRAEDVQVFLNENFLRYEVGSYTVWIKKEDAHARTIR